MAAPAVLPDDPEAWKALARCNGLDPNIFFPGTEDAQGIAFAKSFCEGCSVRQDCLDFAYSYERGHDTNLDLGIYGGMTYKERRLEKRRIRTAARRA